MNPSKLYVPNPQKWVHFFDRVAKGTVNIEQTGSGRKGGLISVEREGHSARQSNSELPIKAVTPAEQTVQQAKSELKRENINLAAVKSHIQTPVKRRRRRITGRHKIVQIGQKGAGRRKVQTSKSMNRKKVRRHRKRIRSKKRKLSKGKKTAHRKRKRTTHRASKGRGRRTSVVDNKQDIFSF